MRITHAIASYSLLSQLDILRNAFSIKFSFPTATIFPKKTI